MPPRVIFEPEVFEIPVGLIAFLTAWFFFLGGCVGSFMNVVIYRVPLGKSVVSPGSRCPQCGHAIRGFDNLPVISWLVLRGRCRDCSLPIPVRYPLVELLVGLIFMALALEVIQPHGPWWLLSIQPREFLSVPWPKLMAAFVYYQLGICTLLCAAYIAWDGQRAPLALFIPAILAGLFFPAYWNEVRPLAHSSSAWPATMLAGLWQGLLGATAGLLLAGIYDYVRDLRNAVGDPRGRLLLAASTIGLMLGWRVALIAMVVGSMIALIWPLLWGRTWRAACAGPLAGLAIASIGLVLGGRLVFERWSLPPAKEWSIVASCVVLIVAQSILARRLGPPPEPDTAADETSLDMIYP